MPEREQQLNILSQEITKQIKDCGLEDQVEHVICEGDEVYGNKMRRSLCDTRGYYISYVDDDDFILPGYIRLIYHALMLTPDVVTFGSYSPGCITYWSRTNRDDDSYKDKLGGIKSANHFCVWKRDIALTGVWLPRSYGADYVWYSLLNTVYPNLAEVHIKQLLYEYRFNPQLTLCQTRQRIDESLEEGRFITYYQHCDGRLFVGVSKDETLPSTIYQSDGSIVSISGMDLYVIKRYEFR